MPTNDSYDCLIVGAGVIGLSLAYELAQRGRQVCVIDRQSPAAEASWAGAGILPPANRATSPDPYEQLRGLSYDLHPQWSARLRAETGIDNEYRVCGGIYLARSVGEAASLVGFRGLCEEQQIAAWPLSPQALAEREPALAELAASNTLRGACLLPGEAQLRNPRHLQALLAACRVRGVTIRQDLPALDFDLAGGRMHGVLTSEGTLSANQYCLTSGAWTRELLLRLGVATGVFPMRGQIVLFRCARIRFHHVLNEGPRYLVPRSDGRVLAGSTEEEAGFDKRNTPEAVADLTDFARDLVPVLRDVPVEKTWAGFRPASFDGLPYLGRLPGLDNAFVAAGHFRSGLYLSPGTAVVMSELMLGLSPQIDLAPFRVGRG